MTTTHSPIISAMLAAVSAAGENTLEHCERLTLDMHTKPNETLAGKKDYVTAIDESNQRQIFAYLKKHFPNIHCYGEELGEDHAKSNPQIGDKQWVLDPIDSTRNLVAGTSDYSISLACQQYTEKGWETIAGVVAMPGKHRTVWAELGAGAHQIVHTPHGTNESPIRITKHHRNGSAAFDERAVEVLLVKEAQALEPSVWQQLHAIDRRIIRMSDSGAMALASIGTERHGIITGGLTDHDKTAGLLIAQEAGAVTKTYSLPYKATPCDTQQQARNCLHLVAADEEMLAAMEQILAKAQGITAVRSDTPTAQVSSVDPVGTSRKPELLR